MYLACAPEHACGSHRIICKSWVFYHESPELNSGHYAWQQAFLLAEPSHCQTDGETEAFKTN